MLAGCQGCSEGVAKVAAKGGHHSDGQSGCPEVGARGGAAVRTYRKLPSHGCPSPAVIEWQLASDGPFACLICTFTNDRTCKLGKVCFHWHVSAAESVGHLRGSNSHSPALANWLLACAKQIFAVLRACFELIGAIGNAN